MSIKILSEASFTLRIITNKMASKNDQFNIECIVYKLEKTIKRIKFEYLFTKHPIIILIKCL